MSSGVAVRGPWHVRQDVSTSGATSASNDCAAAPLDAAASGTARHTKSVRFMPSPVFDDDSRFGPAPGLSDAKPQ